MFKESLVDFFFITCSSLGIKTDDEDDVDSNWTTIKLWMRRKIDFLSLQLKMMREGQASGWGYGWSWVYKSCFATSFKKEPNASWWGKSCVFQVKGKQEKRLNYNFDLKKRDWNLVVTEKDDIS